MIGRRATLRDRIALALLALALAVRLLVPAGWMPAQQGQGFAITLCSGSTTETAWMDADGKLHKQAPAKAGDSHCAFAGLGTPMLGDEAPPVVPPTQVGTAPAASQPLASIGKGLAAPPPPATGPPAIV